jgi:CAAX protease family protein
LKAELECKLETVFEAISFTFIVLAAWGLVYWAWRAESDRSAYVGIYLLIGIPGVLVTIIGLAYGWSGNERGWAAFAIGIGLTAPLIRPVRYLFARISPLDPQSPVDLCGLSVLLAILALNVSTFVRSPRPNIDTGAASLSGVVVQSLAEVALSFAAVGIWVYRSPTESISRLGLVRPTWRMLLAAFGVFILGIIATITAYQLFSHFQHQLVHEYERVIDEISAGSPGPLAALTFGVVVGTGEELLFRGAIQPRFGLVPTAILFTMFHTQYGITWLLLGILANGLLLGILRKRYGTTACILTHLLVDTLAILIGNSA